MEKEGYKDTLTETKSNTGSRTNMGIMKRGTKPNSDMCRHCVIFVKWFSSTSSSYMVCLARREVKQFLFTF